MASPPSSEIELRFRRLDGIPCEPAEWTPLLLELPGSTEDWDSWSVTLNGVSLTVSLRRLAGALHCVCDWPECGAGRHRVMLAHPSWGTSTQELAVAPSKLGNGAFEALLREVEQWLPYALAARLQRGGALGGLELRPPQDTSPAAEFARLRALAIGHSGAPGLQLLLRKIASDPHHVLVERTIDVAQERARRPHPVLLRQALYRGHRVDDAGLPVRLLDRRVESTFDTYENRLLKLVSATLQQRLRRLKPLLPAEVRTEALEVLSDLDRARREADFLDEVSSSEIASLSPTQVLLRRGEYRYLLELWRQLWMSFEVRLEAAALESTLESVPDLYELWGSMAALSEIVTSLVEAGYHVVRQRLVRRRREGPIVELVQGPDPVAELAHSDGSRVAISFQRNFSGSGTPLRSLSFDQRPDIVVAMTSPSDETDLLILDPKYKVETRSGGIGPKKEDIDKMHAYRDAIVHRQHGRVVRHAAILYPGPTQHFGRGISAFSADPLRPDGLGEAIRHVLEGDPAQAGGEFGELSGGASVS